MLAGIPYGLGNLIHFTVVIPQKLDCPADTNTCDIVHKGNSGTLSKYPAQVLWRNVRIVRRIRQGKLFPCKIFFYVFLCIAHQLRRL